METWEECSSWVKKAKRVSEIVMHKTAEGLCPSVTSWRVCLPCLPCAALTSHCTEDPTTCKNKDNRDNLIWIIFSVDRVCPGDLEGEWWRSVKCGSGRCNHAEIREQTEISWQQLKSRKDFFIKSWLDCGKPCHRRVERSEYKWFQKRLDKYLEEGLIPKALPLALKVHKQKRQGQHREVFLGLSVPVLFPPEQLLLPARTFCCVTSAPTQGSFYDLGPPRFWSFLCK